MENRFSVFKNHYLSWLYFFNLLITVLFICMLFRKRRTSQYLLFNVILDQENRYIAFETDPTLTGSFCSWYIFIVYYILKYYILFLLDKIPFVVTIIFIRIPVASFAKFCFIYNETKCIVSYIILL